MKKFISLIIALLIGMSFSKNGNHAVYAATPANVQAIDLGLPSGTLWASCNVGAEKPEEYGNYYAWGEVTPKDEYSWSSYKYAQGTSWNDPRITKYCNNSDYGNEGFTDNKTTLDLEDDAAHVNWGGAWRMPTSTEIDELLDLCTWTWMVQNGVEGYQVTSKTNNNSIFLPAAGYRSSTFFLDGGRDGDYFSASVYEDDINYAWGLNFGLGGPDIYGLNRDGDRRDGGFPIRPVCK